MSMGMDNTDGANEIVDFQFPTVHPGNIQIPVNKKTGSPVKLESRLGHPEAGLSQYLDHMGKFM
jgi:hypothetical protein